MEFADIHNHILFGVDDGAKSEEEMYRLIDASYDDGVRHLCFTPHFHPGYFGENQKQTEESFRRARLYAAGKHPDLALYLGNELRYERSFSEWLRQGRCRTMNGSDYLLVDFLYPEPADSIMDAMLRVLNAGFRPILAHVERYEKFNRNLRDIDLLRSRGVILQVDAQSPLGGLGRGSKVRSRRLIDAGAVDLIASDAHSLHSRPPQLSLCYQFLTKKLGEEEAGKLMLDNPLRIMRNEPLF